MDFIWNHMPKSVPSGQLQTVFTPTLNVSISDHKEHHTRQSTTDQNKAQSTLFTSGSGTSDKNFLSDEETLP